MWRPRPKFKLSFYSYFYCFWISVTQINFENIKRKIERIISDSCFQLKLWFNVDARAPSIPLLNFPFKLRHNDIALTSVYTTDTFCSFTRKVIFKSCFLLSEYGRQLLRALIFQPQYVVTVDINLDLKQPFWLLLMKHHCCQFPVISFHFDTTSFIWSI